MGNDNVPGRAPRGAIPSDSSWDLLMGAPRHQATELRRANIPPTAGVYAWFRGGECVYIGKATDLRSRLSSHRSTSLDMSRSTLRASVAVQELGVTRRFARQRPSAMTPAQVDVVNEWLANCDVAWFQCADGREARTLERRLLADRLPRLNIR